MWPIRKVCPMESVAQPVFFLQFNSFKYCSSKIKWLALKWLRFFKKSQKSPSGRGLLLQTPFVVHVVALVCSPHYLYENPNKKLKLWVPPSAKPGCAPDWGRPYDLRLFQECPLIILTGLKDLDEATKLFTSRKTETEIW